MCCTAFMLKRGARSGMSWKNCKYDAPYDLDGVILESHLC
jgi:hypothetical protein